MYTCDYILVLQKDRVRVTNCGVGHSAPVSSHFPVRCDFRVAHRLCKLRPKPTPATAISYLKLRAPVIAKDFCSKIVATTPDKNTTYPEFTTAFVSAAETTLSEPCPHDPPWFKLSRTVLLPLIAARNTQQAALKLEPSVTNQRAYSLARKRIKKAIRTAKLKWTEIQLEIVNKLGTHPRHAL